MLKVEFTGTIYSCESYGAYFEVEMEDADGQVAKVKLTGNLLRNLGKDVRCKARVTGEAQARIEWWQARDGDPYIEITKVESFVHVE